MSPAIQTVHFAWPHDDADDARALPAPPRASQPPRRTPQVERETTAGAEHARAREEAAAVAARAARTWGPSPSPPPRRRPLRARARAPPPRTRRTRLGLRDDDARVWGSICRPPPPRVAAIANLPSHARGAAPSPATQRCAATAVAAAVHVAGQQTADRLACVRACVCGGPAGEGPAAGRRACPPWTAPRRPSVDRGRRGAGAGDAPGASPRRSRRARTADPVASRCCSRQCYRCSCPWTWSRRLWISGPPRGYGTSTRSCIAKRRCMRRCNPLSSGNGASPAAVRDARPSNYAPRAARRAPWISAACGARTTAASACLRTRGRPPRDRRRR